MSNYRMKVRTRVSALDCFFLPLPLQPLEIGEGRVYFSDAEGEDYYLPFGEVLTWQLDLILALSVPGGK